MFSYLYNVFLAGHGYFYNMTTDLECSSQTLSPFYPIYYWGELVATRVVAFGHFIKDSKFKELFEEFNALTTKVKNSTRQIIKLREFLSFVARIQIPSDLIFEYIQNNLYKFRFCK